jgi:hypothetical protein
VLGRTATIERVVSQLNTVAKMATFDFAMAVGRIVVDAFYGGDFGAWRRRGPKDVSFRTLASHPELSMSPSVLYRSVAMYELCVRLQLGPRGHLSTSHLRLALPLAPDSQTRLLREAEANRWSVRRLEKEVSLLACADTRRRQGGRKRRSRIRTHIEAFAACLKGCDLDGEGYEEDTEGDISPESAGRLLGVLAKLRDACTVLERNIAQHVARVEAGPLRQPAPVVEREAFGE